MQNWLPKSFEADEKTISLSPPKKSESFEIDTGTSGVGASVNAADPTMAFRQESGFFDSETLMANLTQVEREQVFDLVEQDVEAQYAEKEAVLRTELATQLAENNAVCEQAITTWAADFGARIEENIKVSLESAAKESARLAVKLAEKIVRETVNVDPQVLARNIETTLFKIQGDPQICVSVNAEDAEYLEQNPDLRKQLGIDAVTADRRINRGGCLITSGGREWDATINSQMNKLTEIVEDIINTSGSTSPVTRQVNPDDSGLG